MEMKRWLLTPHGGRRGLVNNMVCFFALVAITLVQDVKSGRMFDVTSLSTDTVVTKAGANLTLACPGVTEHSLVLVLEWYCHGCFLTGQSKATQHSSGEVKLVEYRGESTTVWQNRERVTLSPETYGLNFHPVVTGDSGQYSCLFNGRPLPESITKLVVQGIPDPPGRPLILGFTSRAVNLSWAPPLDTHNSRISHYIIHTRVGEDGDWEKSTGIVTENNRTFYQIKGLEPFTVYSFAILAVNALGKSPPSKESYYIVTLREVPDGKPTITAAQNASSTSIKLAWRPPSRNTIHGEFLGYRLAYRPRDKGPDSIQEVYIRDPNIETYIIQDLQTFTQYLVSLQCFNPEGIGPPTTVAVITDEGVPTKPLNLSIHWVTDSKMQLSWSEPSLPNGKLEGYRIFYMQKNFTDVVTVKPPPPNMTGQRDSNNGIVPSLSSNMTFSLSGLEPFTEYKIWVKAFTWKNEGESSVPITVKMDVGGPGPPTIVNLTCQNEESLFVQWRRPSRHHNTLDFFYIDFRRGDWIDFREINVTALDQNEQSILIHNLTSNNLYEIRVRGGTRSVLDLGKVYKGEFSESVKILLEPDCEKVRVFNLPRSSDEFISTLVLGTVGASFLLLFILLTLLVWRRCFHTTYYYLDDPPRIPPLSVTTSGWEGDVSDDMKQAVSAHLFQQHVHELHVDGDIGFSKEYEAIQAASVHEEYAAEHSQHPENKQKNRYLNIVAYDHTRVRLQPMPGQKKCVDYVNANYIDGFKKPRAYIGTQGPLPSTFDSFWRMVWEHKVHIIVMITNLVERGRENHTRLPKLATQCLEKKCDMYWPKEGTETYGVIQVKLLREDVLATYTVRTLLLRHLKLKKKKKVNNLERTVYQYHYTNWPDHGIPSNPLPVLSFVKKSSMANPPDAGPIIVHCSAGVGRTGAYIVLDAMLRQIKTRGDLNIFGFLHHIRGQRNFLVQTEEQYIFIHDALLEAIESGETNINRSYIVRYIHTLLSGSYADEKCQVSSLLDHQFKLVTKFHPKENHMSSALKVYNLTKNRNLDCVCTDSYRVMLSPRPGIEGSDYINASFLPGYHRLQEFILTQHPLESTIGDFWQLLWDHNVQMVVLLSLVDDQDYPTFWPVHNEDLDLDTFRVKLVQESDRIGYVVRDFTIQSLQDDYELGVKMVQSSHWPYHCSSNSTNMFDLVQVVQKATSETYNGPVVVIDRFGAVEGATFCALTTLYKQLECESFVDVYLYAKLYHEQRPGVWKTLNDYLLLYQSIEALARSRNSELALTPSSPSPLLPPPMNGVDTYITIPSVVPTATNGRACHEKNGTFRAPPDGMETVDHRIIDPIV